MKTEEHEDEGLKTTAYRLRKSVRYCQRDDDLLLVLAYPLKVIVLDPAWKQVLRLLSMGEFIPLEKLAHLIDFEDPEKIELFLDDLVRKGYLEREGFSSLSDYPFVSVIIPVRNRPEEIEDCLQSLGKLDYPSEKLEIIVVDDASSDNTPDVVSGYSVHLIPLEAHKQASFCRNLAARKARGEILAFIDSDCLADPQWLKALIPVFRDHTIGALGGRVDTYFNEKGLDRYEKVKSSLTMGSWTRRSSKNDPFFYVPSCNLLVRRENFLQLGGFGEDLVVGEDVDLCWRLQDEGLDVEYRPLGKVYHKHRNRLGSFSMRRFDYGTSEPLLQQRHPKRTKRMVFPPGESLFWGFTILSTILQYHPLLVLSGLVLLMDTLAKYTRTRRQDIPIRFHSLLVAVFRIYLSFFYHGCSFISRYYFLFAFLIFPLVPVAAMVIFGAHLLTGIVEFIVKKPSLNALSFLFYFSLEQSAYQAGVWWGCIKNLYFNPVNPQVATRQPQEA